MTIKGLHDLLRKTGKCFTGVQLEKIGSSTLKAKPPRRFRLAIDASEFMYKFHYMCKKDSMATTYFQWDSDKGCWYGLDQQDIDYRVCESFRRQVLYFRKFNIESIYVFDGPPRPEKEETKNKRSDDNKKKLAEIEKWERDPNAKDMYRTSLASYNVPCPHYKAMVMGYLSLLGCQYYQAKWESDELLAQLNKNGLVDAVLSEDGDQVAYGVKFWIKEIKSGTATVSSSDIIRNQLGLGTQAQLRAFCIANGTDYNNNIHGKGPVANLKAIVECKDIEELVSSNPIYAPLKWQAAEEIFSSEVTIPNPNTPAPDLDLFASRWDDDHKDLYKELIGDVGSK